MKKITTFVLIVSILLPNFAWAKTNGEVTNPEKIQGLQKEIADLSALINPSSIKSLSANEKNAVIKNAVGWIQADQEANGHMKYEYSPYADTYSTEDNIVRQTGALYEMGEVIRRDTNHVYDLEPNIIKSINYFTTMTKTGTYAGKSFKCIAGSPTSTMCKVGTTSLAVTGMISYVQAHPSVASKYEALIDSYMNYILAMRKTDGSLREVFHTATNLADEPDSPYANGEAMLALVRYGEYKNFPTEVTYTIDKMFAYIQKVPFDSSLYLWAMAAIKDLNAISPKSEYFTYVKNYTDWRISPFTSKKSDGHNYCPYIEGVASAYPVLEKNLSSSALSKYKNEIELWLAKGAMLQINSDDLIKFDPTSPTLFSKITSPEKALGGFLTGQSELTERVDFTQHCLSSYLQDYVDIEGQTLKK